MAKFFYARLACGNLLRNKRMYGPYCVATALMSGIFFTILNLVFSRSISNLSYGPTVQMMFTIGIVVMTLFTVGYMLYINSFLIKRRKKEFGLYAVLGMERRHIARVILCENALISYGALLLGLVGGMVFGRLIFLLLLRMLGTAPGSRYVLSIGAVVVTVIIFSVIFLVTSLYNLNQVRISNPIDLLHGAQQGEKKVRFVLPMTLIGLAALGFAYYLAITVRNSGMALLVFWPAVILVILATWMLFTSGSTYVLRRLQRSKRIYYQPRNFITISGLIHRMKQNAAGLSNICILSTMVMVTVSCCFSLYAGMDGILREQNPYDLSMTIRLEDTDARTNIIDQTIDEANRFSAAHDITIDVLQYRYQQQNVLYQDGALVYHNADGTLPYSLNNALEALVSTQVLLLDDFTAATGRADSLAQGEVLLLSGSRFAALETIPCDGGALTVVNRLSGTPFTQGPNSAQDDILFLVVPDMDAADRLVHSIDPMLPRANMMTALKFGTDADQETGLLLSDAVLGTFRSLCRQAEEGAHPDINYLTSSIYESRIDGYSLYGGLLFLGVFFALLFLINTVLILYFKQISEGMDDATRFTILQKVGLSDSEVKSTINRQMLIVFLLPLVVALVHIAAASNLIMTMLGSFMLSDFKLTMLCILITSVVFIAVYLCMYRITARTYYRLVKW